MLMKFKIGKFIRKVCSASENLKATLERVEKEEIMAKQIEDERAKNEARRQFEELERERQIREAKHLQEKQEQLDQEERNQKRQLVVEAEQIERAELERQNHLKNFPLENHLSEFIQRAEELTNEKCLGDRHSEFLTLYQILKHKFETFGMIGVERLSHVSDDVHRVNQIETVIDFYWEKIRRVRNDPTLDDYERQRKMEYWERIMDSHISEIENPGGRG
jgi:hypothetical protein